MKRHSTIALLAAILASPMALAVGTGPTHPDNPHGTMPEAGTESTRNPTQAPVPRDTDPRVQGSGQQTSPAEQSVDPRLPGMDGSGSEGSAAGQGDAGSGQQR
ncbi:hypothetical protein PS627_00196 [Pseudomonas fluorescens]|uniref:hypothetical protein n=1 Tax=Pseudomonas fluorescens TaxID=294 RepID=UPI001255D175|nr:hypothetical protein [Pseudomonas fluorescens]CAG8863260.1 hypothetical protein PS627_00196 [Pseudomonas fluorescens]VVQ05535.1 hypothetical protein PS910_04261 [Pseudomonas fluorescens]